MRLAPHLRVVDEDVFEHGLFHPDGVSRLYAVSERVQLGVQRFEEHGVDLRRFGGGRTRLLGE